MELPLSQLYVGKREAPEQIRRVEIDETGRAIAYLGNGKVFKPRTSGLFALPEFTSRVRALEPRAGARQPTADRINVSWMDALIQGQQQRIEGTRRMTARLRAERQGADGGDRFAQFAGEFKTSLEVRNGALHRLSMSRRGRELGSITHEYFVADRGLSLIRRTIIEESAPAGEPRRLTINFSNYRIDGREVAQ
jgi:hypothetical protein